MNPLWTCESVLMFGITATELTSNCLIHLIQLIQCDRTMFPTRWPHLAALLLLFLLLVFIPTGAKVVDSISDCEEFFLSHHDHHHPPEIPEILKGGKVTDSKRYKVICQVYLNKRRFVTLYDIKNKIPVFSAYVYRGQNVRGRPKNPLWRVEPQVGSSLQL